MIFRRLLWAQLVEVRRNPMLAMLPFVPMLLAFLYRMPGGNDGGKMMLLEMVMMMSIYMVGWQLPAMSLGEEKEKRTLEALLLTPARPLQIVLSRAAMGVIMSLVTGVGAMLVMGVQGLHLPALLGAYLLSLVFAASGGLLMGLVLPDQRSVSVVGSVLMLALVFSGLPPLGKYFPTYWTIAGFLPTRPMQELIGYGFTGEGTDLVRHVVVLIVWSVLAVGLCAARMRKSASLR